MLKRDRYRWSRPIQRDFYANCKTVRSLDDVPSHPSNTIYVVNRGGKDRWAVVSCPCGCQSRIEVNLMRSHRPSWRMRRHKDGKVSFFPSLWVSDDRCGSHFWIIKSSVLWADPFPRMGPSGGGEQHSWDA